VIMGTPDIFFFPPKGAPWSQPCFVSLGRLLALSQRVESHCRTLALHIKLRLAGPSPLESEAALRAFSESLWKQTLNEHVTYLTNFYGSEPELHAILDRARIARNEVAHEVSLGFEHWAYDESLMLEERDRIRELAVTLARADHLTCTIASVLSNEPLPVGEAYRKYPERLTEWVCNTDNGEPW
jgi:hypothetical protein